MGQSRLSERDLTDHVNLTRVTVVNTCEVWPGCRLLNGVVYIVVRFKYLLEYNYI